MVVHMALKSAAIKVFLIIQSYLGFAPQRYSFSGKRPRDFPIISTNKVEKMTERTLLHHDLTAIAHIHTGLCGSAIETTPR